MGSVGRSRLTWMRQLICGPKIIAVMSLLFASAVTFAAPLVPTVGFLPKTFPRDPVLFDFIYEHMAIGQVTETLVSADRNGNVVPALAEAWSIKDGGRTLVFKIRSDIVFSNGQKLTPEDIASSLNRHRLDPRSQTHGLLTRVQAIRADGESVSIRLTQPQMAILKVLSRDQLGVLPQGWSFNPTLHEPFTGTGPYRLVRERGRWFFVKNERYRAPEDVRVARWEVLMGGEESQLKGGLPDFCPLVRIDEINSWREQKKMTAETHLAKEYLSFVQNSAWWYPHGPQYFDPKLRHIKMTAIRRLFAIRIKRLGVKPATGLIPFGVAGYLPRELHLDEDDVPRLQAQFAGQPDAKLVRVAISRRLITETFEPEARQQVEREMGVKFVVLPADTRDERFALATKPDIVIDRWSGGFNDPEGFLPIIPELVDQPLKPYLQSLLSAYTEANSEQDWTARAEKYRRLNERLVLEERLVPGWRTNTFSVLSVRLREVAAIYRYTPRLTDIGEAQ